MSELRIMDKDAGDLKVIWDSENEDEVSAARTQFESLIKKGFNAFSVDKKGEAGRKITKFDPDAEKIIMIPAIVGG